MSKNSFPSTIPFLGIIVITTAYVDETNSLEENFDDTGNFSYFGENGNVGEWVKSQKIFKDVKINNVVPGNVKIPLLWCPEVFHYRFANEFGGFFGVVTIQKPLEVEKIEVELNMSLERPVDIINNLKMILLTNQKHVVTSDVINWAVIFPYQDLLPNLVSVQCNNRIICRNRVDLGFPGSTVFKLSVRAELNMNESVNNPEEMQVNHRKQKRLLRTTSENKYSNYMNNNVNLLLPGYGLPPVHVARGVDGIHSRLQDDYD